KFILAVCAVAMLGLGPRSLLAQTLPSPPFPPLPPFPGCAYSITPPPLTLTSNAQTNTLAISTGQNCLWNVTTNTGWITISSTDIHAGNGIATYSITANSGTASRSGTVVIAGQAIDVTQQGTPAGTVTSFTLATSGSPGNGGALIRDSTQTSYPSGTA